MSLARNTVEEVLTNALGGIVVDQTTRATAYLNGRVWVLLASWSRSVEGPGEQVAVIAAVPAGHHNTLDTLVDSIFNALRTDGRCDPSSFDTAYGVKEPIAGRSPSNLEADIANIIVNTPFDR